jgi:hypothetical protein
MLKEVIPRHLFVFQKILSTNGTHINTGVLTAEVKIRSECALAVETIKSYKYQLIKNTVINYNSITKKECGILLLFEEVTFK